MRYILIQIIFLLFAVTVTHALPSAPVPQTGQTSCWDSTGVQIGCTSTGQDGGLQAGVVWPAPRFTSNADQTVSDNLTGLIWSKSANPAGEKTWQQALDYINSLNSQNWLGHSDWRLPNINELQSLINRQQSDVATWLNSQGFSHIQANYYWSGSTIANTTYGAWVVHMSQGGVAGVSKTYGYGYVWPVRPGQSGSFNSVDISKTGQTGCWNVSGTPINCTGTGQDGELQTGVAWPSPRFTSNANLTVNDNLTGLAWSKNGNPSLRTLTWQQALDYIKGLNNQNWLGYSDWRLPNINELQSLINRQQGDVATWLNSQGFSNATPALNYWSSSTYTRNTASAWSVGMDAGVVVDDYKAGNGYVWPVRSGQLNTIGRLDILKLGTGYGSGQVKPSSGTIAWSGSAGFENYPIGSVITLTATSNSGSVLFGGWSGCDSVNGAICSVTINGLQQVTATFNDANSTFAIPSTSTTLTVPIITFTAMNGVQVTDYCLTEINNGASCTWTVNAPTSYTFAADGIKTLYAFTKDATGNISSSGSATVTVATIPVITAFTIPATSKTLTVPITTFTATDAVAVTGYLITTTGTVPLSTDPAWSATAPTSVTLPPTTLSGACTLYAWAKDNAGNISSSLSASVTIDLAVPTVTAFSLAPYINSLTVPVKQFTAIGIFGGITGYCLTEVNDSSGCNWSATAPISYTFSSIGSKTLYAWAKDAAGNISEPVNVPLDLCAVTAASDANGNITLPGTSYYYCSQNRLYKISPKPGYRIADLKVDGLTVGKISNYLFTSMATPGNHTIAATFELDPFANWHQVAPGYLHTIAVRSDGSMWGWGDNSGYQLGDGTTNTRHNPIRVTAYTDWQTAAAGPYHSLGRRTNGNLYGWGDNTSGQLGESDSPLPVLIDSSAYWQELFAAGTTLSSSYSLARKSDGSFKQLGASPSGSIAASNTIDWVTLAAGTSHTAAIRADGTIWSWGSNSKGQLGDNSKTSRITPVLTGSANNWVQVAAGKAHTVGLQANGTLWTWGDNSWGQLGTDRIPNALATPLQIGSGQSWKGIAAGDDHTLALRSDGTIWAFGNNTHGQLGDGSNATVNLPVQVGTDSDWKSIVAHGDLSFGIKNNNTLHAWGANDKGQLGDTSTVDKFSPVLVATNTNSFVITATAGNGGNISPSGITTNPVGTSKTFSIASLVGWKISDVKVDGVSVGAVTSYTFNNIIDSHVIVALFSAEGNVTHTITASTNVGASISPNGTVNVAGGNSQVFSIAPQSNYTISDVIVDGVSQGSLGTYTFSNVSSSHLIQAVATLIDNTAPTGSVSINGGAAYTNKTAVSAALSVKDNGSGISKMRFSYDNVVWLAWENYLTSKNFTLSAGNGTKNLYVQYNDAAGNTSIPYHASIILDTLPPTGSVTLNGGAASTNSATVTATISATDSGGTVAQMQFSWDNINWQAWQAYAVSKNLTLPTSGFNTLYVRFKDAAGNISSVVNTSIVYNQLMPLTLTVSGNGTVNSVPSGFSCGTGSCSANYAIGTQIRLMATAGVDSTFSAWSGSCNGNADCNLTMDSAKSVTATFLAAPKVRVGVKPFSTIQAAYNDSVTTIDKSVIMLLEGVLARAFTADRMITVTLEGGYDATFGKVASETVIQSPLVIKSGTVVINGIVIQ